MERRRRADEIRGWRLRSGDQMVVRFELDSCDNMDLYRFRCDRKFGRGRRLPLQNEERVIRIFVISFGRLIADQNNCAVGDENREQVNIWAINSRRLEQAQEPELRLGNIPGSVTFSSPSVSPDSPHAYCFLSIIKPNFPIPEAQVELSHSRAHQIDAFHK